MTESRRKQLITLRRKMQKLVFSPCDKTADQAERILDKICNRLNPKRQAQASLYDMIDKADYRDLQGQYRTLGLGNPIGKKRHHLIARIVCATK